MWRASANRKFSERTATESPSTAVITPLLGGRFARLDYTWSYRGSPQEGSLLVGYRPDAEVVTAHCIDTWHMGHEVMACIVKKYPKLTLLPEAIKLCS